MEAGSAYVRHSWHDMDDLGMADIDPVTGEVVRVEGMTAAAPSETCLPCRISKVGWGLPPTLGSDPPPPPAGPLRQERAVRALRAAEYGLRRADGAHTRARPYLKGPRISSRIGRCILCRTMSAQNGYARASSMHPLGLRREEPAFQWQVAMR